MESVVDGQSPLAVYLEGEGKAEPSWDQQEHDQSTSPSISISSSPPSFAPRGTSTLHSRIRDKLPQPLQIPLNNQGPAARIHSACSRAVTSRIGRADNQRFLEQFRYVIVASRLLNDETAPTLLRPRATSTAGINAPSPSDSKTSHSNLAGALMTFGCTFTLVWLLHWARGSKTGGPHKGRSFFVAGVFLVVALTLYSYVRRQWLQGLRQHAANSASVLVNNLQAFDASTSSAISFIQEVELISRGYRLSCPLPPITRLDDKNQNKRCIRLRHTARNSLAATIPAFIEKNELLRSLIERDDLDKYLDIYDIAHQDLQEAFMGYSESEFDDNDNLKVLRILQYRQNILRRVLLCSLLALEADGSGPDFTRWREAVQTMDTLATMTATWSEKINNILNDQEQFLTPEPPKSPATPGKDKLRAQIRQISGLSHGIRGLQAKMQILREESNKGLEGAEDINELGSDLLSQYDSIGADIQHLVQAWESGRSALALNIDRHERRVSQASNGLRSPTSSLGGLTVVEEGNASDALRALNGDSAVESTPTSASGHNSDEEIFEAISIPRQRPLTMSRDERKAKLEADRIRRQSAIERVDASQSMLKELQSVINLRPHQSKAKNRITTI